VSPDGTILGAKLLKKSGQADWDEAVLKAIEKTEKLPLDTDGRIPPVIIMDLRPRD
jgi:colicin import membrane protein